MNERTYTTEQAAAELGVPRSLIAKWKHRQLVTPAGFAKGRGRDAPLYRLDELRPLADRYHATNQPPSTRRDQSNRLQGNGQ